MLPVLAALAEREAGTLADDDPRAIALAQSFPVEEFTPARVIRDVTAICRGVANILAQHAARGASSQRVELPDEPLIERYERSWHQVRGPPDPSNDQRPIRKNGALGTAEAADVCEETSHHTAATVTRHAINAAQRKILRPRLATRFRAETAWAIEHLDLVEAESIWLAAAYSAGRPFATEPNTDPSTPRPAPASRRRAKTKSDRARPRRRRHHHRR